MRTTLTIDDDVAAQIERLRKARDASLKDVVNDALRRGLRDMAAPPVARRPFRIRVFGGGAQLIDIDNVWEAMAQAEGDDFK
jgi:hypothetical protein